MVSVMIVSARTYEPDNHSSLSMSILSSNLKAGRNVCLLLFAFLGNLHKVLQSLQDKCIFKIKGSFLHVYFLWQK